MNNSVVEIRFVKMTGAGNDFVLIDAIEANPDLPWSTLAPILCDRRYGVGADGLLILEKSGSADFRMNYFNADGSYGGMCGNGGRCSAHYVMERFGLDKVKFEALDYIYSAESHNQNIILKMKDVNSFEKNIILQTPYGKIEGHYIDTGAPHLVIFVDQLTDLLQQQISKNGIVELGKLLRFHEKFAPEGTNVDFIKLLSENSISMRTYERGVEDETLACGTGAVASALCSSITEQLASPINVHTKSNEVLKVHFNNRGKLYTDIRLEGAAKVVFHGTFYYSVKEKQLNHTKMRTKA